MAPRSPCVVARVGVEPSGALTRGSNLWMGLSSSLRPHRDLTGFLTGCR
jgi:hypothetical protein